MDIKMYVDQKKKIYDILVELLDNDLINDEYYYCLFNIIKSQNIMNKKEEFQQFLHLIARISTNHHRDSNLICNIEKILFEFKNHIKQTFSNLEIFNIFNQDKLILLFLLKNQIMSIDEENIKYLLSEIYCHFFLPEIKKFIPIERIKQIENRIIEIESYGLYNFDKKWLEGENTSYICSLIRKDLINEFIEYINKENLPLSSEIKPSIFESNSFLIDKNINLFEYAAFFGSIHICKYLFKNKAKQNKKLLLYAIHSRNAELIHLIEENISNIDDKIYEKCYKESIKCHHNDIANYFLNNLSFKNKYISWALKYHNYSFIPDNIDQKKYIFLFKSI